MIQYLEIPVIVSASFSPNPVDINKKATVSVEIAEKRIELQPEIYYSGEIYSGEV